MSSLKRKRIILAVLIVLMVWICAFFADFLAVTEFEHEPLFCVETKGHRYIGAGYAFDIYRHSITGEMQYALYLFGRMADSTFTD